MNHLELPIHQYRTKILASLKQNRVLVISGRTGCGKSTQVPKYILEDCPKAKIAVCQPRRLAATCLAARVSEELACKIGSIVGYQIGMESKFSEKTQIVYMTYGILIQQLLFNDKIGYTHIILDEVHERSLEMDFTFIALKKILDNQQKRQTKIVIMSATINSHQFAKHFSTHTQTKQFLKPTITYREQERKRGSNRSNRNRHTEDGNSQFGNLQLDVDISFNRHQYQQAESIILPDKNKYKVIQYFHEDLANQGIVSNAPYYAVNEDVRIREDTYELATKIVAKCLKLQSKYIDTNQQNKQVANSKYDKHTQKIQGQDKNGDILIFVPGMYQIKYMKELLIQKYRLDPNQIIQVHSAYSDQLFKRLFIDQIQNKIIIATNIGESSITLPFCKIVIDFCLNRKNITVKIKGYSRFQTRVASKANLMQRSGRVGRNSDGVVYRLITTQLYKQLEQFDVPQIQCVSLDMVILRAKQIDKTYNSTIFQDVYQVFLSALQPPKYTQIHSTIQYLLREQALSLQESRQSQSLSGPSFNSLKNLSTLKYKCSHLKITKIGQFMVSMPCNIRISKMILHSLQFGITSSIVDIAAILLTQKTFFVHQEKRVNIQQWMHSIVGYDRGDYNDFMIRQRMFSHWRTIYFQSYKKQKGSATNNGFKEKGNKESHAFQTQKLLQMFNNERITQNQWNWCNDRGVSPWVMRDILRISQNIRQRLYSEQIKIQRGKEQQKTQNQMIIYCICIAFEDTTCEIQWGGYRDKSILAKKANSKDKKDKTQNWVSLIQAQNITTQKMLEQFMHPEKDYDIQYESGGFIKIRGSCQVMSKLLLPRSYSKASNLAGTSQLFQYLASNPSKAIYVYQCPLIKQRVREVTILNDSINKVNIRPLHNQEYMLVTDKIFDSKGKYYMGACALVQKKVLILIKMMTAKKVQLQMHVSGEFYVKVKINGDIMELPFILSNENINIIRQLRRFNQQDVSKIIQQPKLLQNSKRSKFYNLLTETPLKPKIQHWTYLFNQLCQKYKKFEQPAVNINSCRLLKQIKQKQSYFQRYKRWKVQEYDDLYINFKLMTVRQGSIICSKCWPNHLTLIQQLQSFCTTKKNLKLNQYRGSWIRKDNSLYCSKKHRIGHAINSDEGDVEYGNILMYSPMGKTTKFDGQKQSIKQMLKKVEEGNRLIDQQRKKCYQFQCKICATYDQFDKVKTYAIQKQDGDSERFWKKISDHMYSKKHIQNLDKFLACV